MAKRKTDSLNVAVAAADDMYMGAALTLARRGLGNVWPNPAVGCVLVRPGPDGGAQGSRVLGRGWTQPGGRPHAETEALARAGAAARGATAYVTLEPCSHHGETPPCAEALVAAGIARAVIALEDPDPRVAGRGLAALREAGIEATTGVLGEQAAAVNQGYLSRIRAGRPMVTLKTATSLDGYIASASGESKWITGETARRWGHALRARHDGIMVGIGTALADDPELTCRLAGLPPRPPVRIVMDSTLRLPVDGKLARGARDAPLWVVTGSGIASERRQALESLGAEVLEIETGADGRPDPAAALAALAERGLTRLLVEGGGLLAASLLAAGLVDRLAWFRAARVIGGDGVPAAAGFGIDRPGDAPGFVLEDRRQAGDDALETYRRAT